MRKLCEFITETLDDNKVFIVVKPGFLQLSNNIISMFEREGFKLYQIRTKQLLMNEAKRLYYMHKNEDFYYRLCKYMSSGSSMGITFTFKCSQKEAFKKCDKLKDNIREKYSESDMRNVMHSSDNFENMKKESSIYF